MGQRHTTVCSNTTINRRDIERERERDSLTDTIPMTDCVSQFNFVTDRREKCLDVSHVALRRQSKHRGR